MNRELIYCPLCSNKVPSDSERCPFCGTRLETVITKREMDKVIEKRLMQRLQAEQAKEEFLEAERQSVGLPETKMSCPSCGVALESGVVKCPRCGVPVAPEEDKHECPECGAVVAAGADKCPSCGAAFEAEKLEIAEPLIDRTPEAVEEPVAPEEAGPPESVRTPLTEPRMADIGRVNGTGLVNGTGMVNGVGITNGTGKINGTRGEVQPLRTRPRRLAPLTRWPFLAVLVALLIIIPAFIYFAYRTESGPFNVDGDFSEWSDVDMHAMRVEASSSPSIDVDEWAVRADANDLYLYVKTEGDILASSLASSFYLFVDIDDSGSSGYVVGSLGADYLMELDGWDGSVESSALLSFDDGDEHDWNAWAQMGSLSHRMDGPELEAKAALPAASTPEAAKYLLMSQDELERRAISYETPYEGGVLVVRQEPLAPSSGIVPSDEEVAVLRLTISCQGAEGTLQSLSFTKSGVTTSPSIGDGISLSPGDAPEVIEVFADLSTASAGDLFSVAFDADSSEWTFSHSQTYGEPFAAYVDAAPGSIAIDGAFADWTGLLLSDSDAEPVENPNIDIDQIGAVNDPASSYFYVSVDGEICSGAYVPAIKQIPSGTADGTPVTPRRNAGEDHIRIYVDSDSSASTGYPVAYASQMIGADQMVEVVGQFGEVLDESLYEYEGGEWHEVLVSIDVAKDAQRMEIGLPAAAFGAEPTLDFVIEATDWKDRSDAAMFDSLAAGAYTLVLDAGADLRGWVVDTSMASSWATSMSYQRKLFYDGTNFWSFYWDGSDTVYASSSDGGATWSNDGAVFSSMSGINETSLWYDSANEIVYIVGDTSSSTSNVYIQRGSVNPATAEITWGNQKILSASTSLMPGKNTFICKDSDGYLWLVSTSRVHATQSQYDLFIYQSDAVDDVEGTWTFSDELISPWSASPNAKATIVPGKAGSGTVVWAIYTYDGGVYGRSYNGAVWSAQEEIYLPGVSTENTDWAPPAAVVDGDGVVHVVYGTGDTTGGNWKASIQYAYDGGAGWSTPITLNDTTTRGHICPTVSLDTTTGDVYAMWLQEVTDEVFVKRNASGSWAWVTIDQNAEPKSHLTSIYSVAGCQNICMQWTQNFTADIEVIFEKIPEFSEVVIPVMFILTVFVASRVRSRNCSRTSNGRDE
ncbi:MAG: zinc ribbon domain-containing protein [Methanobacteriota archaeon]|nr:MAG: zinc ribbon domain-containing protein [Euryarchaeota archaeon]